MALRLLAADEASCVIRSIQISNAILLVQVGKLQEHLLQCCLAERVLLHVQFIHKSTKSQNVSIFRFFFFPKPIIDKYSIIIF